MDGVVEVANVDGPDSNADQGDNLGQLLAELVQLGLQRSLLLLGGSHLVTDLANLSGDSGGNSNTDGLASSDVGALQRREDREEKGEKQVLGGKLSVTGKKSMKNSCNSEDKILMLWHLQRKACSSCPG